MRFFKLSLFLTIILTFAICNLSFVISRASAADAFPGGGKIPCNANPSDPEFNSDRPYQASPCGDSPKALFCTNSIVATIGSVSTPWTGSGYQRCTGHCSGEVKQLIIDLSNVQLPVLGNTQQIKNGVSSDSSLDDATRMNEYVSSYLNGTTDQAEYGQTDVGNVVDFSGPIKKLLPQQIQEAQRIVTINNTKTSVTSAPDDSGKTSPELSNHNQIVVCYDKPVAVLPWLTNLFGLPPFGLGKATAKDCYDQSHDYTLRLNGWDNTAFDVLKDEIAKYLAKFIPQNIITQLISESAILDRWPEKIPPLPWADQNNKPFTTNDAYTKAYNEWRGDLCAYIDFPFFGKKLFCIGIPGITNSDYADLFPYIPLANTVDKSSGQTINSVEIKSDGALFDSKGYDKVTPPKLYFAHTQESADLSALLQETYKSASISGQTVSTDIENNSSCQTVRSYTNPGDDASFSTPKSFLEVDGIKYHVAEIKCPDSVERHKICKDPLDPTNCIFTTPDCSADVTVTIPMQNKTPYLNEIWNTTVAGDQSVFRKIFPQPTTGAPVSCIADIPAVSKITYTSNVGPKIDKVIEPDGSGTGTDAQIYFPHLGSVYDYFLQGIQTALRPKGFGQTITSDACSSDNTTGGGDCSFSMTKIKAAIQKAAAKYNVPASLLQAIFEIESADEIVHPETYKCEENSAGAAGVTQIVKNTYDHVTCQNERIANDIGVCTKNTGKLSRCNIDDAFELEARVLLWKAGKLNGCTPTGTMSLSNKIEWYNASCNYYGSFAPDNLTIAYGNSVPASERRSDGPMNYCDIVCHTLGKCPPYPAR